MIAEGCAGPGGWSVGLEELGVEDAVGYELNVEAIETARAAGHMRVEADVRTMSTDLLSSFSGSVEGLVFSPPCPAFSIGGLHGGQRDINRIMSLMEPGTLDASKPLEIPTDSWADIESPLVLEPLRWAMAMRPSWIALEQVPRAAPAYHRIAANLRLWGYSAIVRTVDAYRYGVPQSRERVILLASLDKQVRFPAFERSEFNLRKHHLDVDLPRYVNMVDALGLDADLLVGSTRPADRINDVDVIMLEGRPCRRRDLRSTVYPSKTVTGKSKWWCLWHPGADGYERGRQLTHEETSLLQTFPPGYPWRGGSDGKIAQQIGNAVPPRFARTMLAAVMNRTPTT